MRDMVRALLIWSMVAVPVPVWAQGHGHGPTSSQPSPAGTGARNFGAWLDDATVMPPGSGWVSLSTGFWRTALFRQTDVPVVDAGYGLTRRVQIGGSMPFYHAQDLSGTVSRGVGDVYLNAKIELLDPSDAHRPVGLAVIPLLEIVAGDTSGAGRAHWALPVSVEVRRARFRSYGAGGYFSRGAVFTSGAVEVPIGTHAIAFGSLTHSYSTRQDALSTALALNRHRADAGGGASFALSPAATLYGSLGRTISRRDATSATLSMNAGVSFTFQTSSPAPPRRR